MLIGNLMIAPLIGKAFRLFTPKECALFLGIGLIFNLCVTISAVFDVSFEYSYIFGGWTFYFYLSYCMEKLFTRKFHIRLLWGAAAICLFVTVVLKYQGITTFIHDISPLFTIFTMGVFSILKTIGTWKFPYKAKIAVQFLAKHSFSVYLIHMIVLESVIPILPIMSGVTSILCHIGVTVFVLMVSIIISVTVDYLLLFPLNRLLLKPVMGLLHKF